MTILRWLYNFVVGDPWLLAGGALSVLLGAILRHVLGSLDGIVVAVAVMATLTISLARRPE